MKAWTIHAKVVAKEIDLGYITYVFKNLDNNDLFDSYLMCTQFPNWQCRELQINDIGYVTVEEHIAGVDTFFDGKNFQKYGFTGIQFIKFIDEPININSEIIL